MTGPHTMLASLLVVATAQPIEAVSYRRQEMAAGTVGIVQESADLAKITEHVGVGIVIRVGIHYPRDSLPPAGYSAVGPLTWRRNGGAVTTASPLIYKQAVHYSACKQRQVAVRSNIVLILYLLERYSLP